jgi:hypothetical protein
MVVLGVCDWLESHLRKIVGRSASKRENHRTMKTYEFRSLGMMGEMYNEDGEESGIASGTKFYLASEVDEKIAQLQHAWEVERLANQPKGDVVALRREPSQS